jgi:predicted deacylase
MGLAAFCAGASARAETGEAAATGTLLPDTRFATPYYVHDSGKPGPVVLVTGGVHGDEPAGAAAADEIRHWTVNRGRLIVIPRINMTALAAHQRRIPDVEASLEDLNRDFPHVGTKELPRGVLAAGIWRFVGEQKLDWLVDLHESLTLHDARTGSVGNMLLCCPSTDMTAAQPAMLKAVNASISDPRCEFRFGRAPKDGSLARAAGTQLNVRSLIIETTRKDQPLAVRVEHHCRLVRALLKHLNMEPSSEIEDHR